MRVGAYHKQELKSLAYRKELEIYSPAIERLSRNTVRLSIVKSVLRPVKGWNTSLNTSPDHVYYIIITWMLDGNYF